MRDDHLAKRMFFAGCFGLPLLWFFNVLYFRKEVFGPIPYFDSQNDNDNDDDDERDEATHRGGGGGAINTNNIPNFGALGSSDSDSEDDSEGEELEEQSISPYELKMELSKWVRRSTLGSFVSFLVFISWNLVFQMKKSSFGPGWFIMSEDEGEFTGW